MGRTHSVSPVESRGKGEGWKQLWKQIYSGMAIPQKMKNIITMWPSNSTSRYISKRTESKDLSRYLYSRVQSSIIHNSQNVKAIRVSIDGWTDTQNVMLYYCTMEHLFTLKKGGNYGTCYNMDEPWFLEKLSQMKQTNHKDKYHMIHLWHTESSRVSMGWR